MKLSFNLFLFSFLIFSGSAFGQLKVISGGYIGVNADPNSSQMLLLKGGFAQNAMYINTTTSGGYTKWGLYNRMSGGHGLKYGIYNFMSNSGAGALYAYRNLSFHSGSGLAIAVDAYAADNTSSSSASSVHPLTGVKMSLDVYRRTAYGAYTSVVNYNNISTKNVYGNFVKVATASGNGTPSPSYGVYVDGNTASNFIAGYFDGDVYANGLLVSSDLRLKDDIEDIKGALDILQRIQPKKYRYRSDTRRTTPTDDTEHYGFIAQEVAEVLPHIVKDVHHPAIYEYIDPERDSLIADFNGREGSVPGIHTDERGFRRIEVKPAEDLKAIRYIELIAFLTQAVKEQQIQIDDLNLSLLNKSASTDDNDLEIENTRLQRENVELKASFTEFKESLNALGAEIDQLRNCTDCFGEIKASIDIGGNEQGVKIYPNPASGQVTVNNSIDAVYSINVLTADGRKYASVEATSPVTKINTSSWPAGTYIFQIYSSDGKLQEQHRVVVSR